MPRTCAKQPSLIFENYLYEFINYRPILLVIWWIPAAGLFCNQNEKIIIPDNHNKWFPTYSSMKMEMYSKAISHFERYLHSGCFKKRKREKRNGGKMAVLRDGLIGWPFRLANVTVAPLKQTLPISSGSRGGWRSSWYWSALFLVLYLTSIRTEINWIWFRVWALMDFSLTAQIALGLALVLKWQ